MTVRTSGVSVAFLDERDAMTERRDPGADSRDAAERFGDRMEDAADDVGDAVDALRGQPDRDTSPDDPPRDDDGGDINIEINR